MAGTRLSVCDGVDEVEVETEFWGEVMGQLCCEGRGLRAELEGETEDEEEEDQEGIEGEGE